MSSTKNDPVGDKTHGATNAKRTIYLKENNGGVSPESVNARDQLSSDAPLYFIGERAKLGAVKPSRATSFAEFAAELLRTAPTITKTRAEFAELVAVDVAKADKLKCVDFYTASTFDGKASKRTKSQALKGDCNTITLDIDQPEHAKAVLRDASTKLAEFRHLIYSTAKSTPEAPRIRLIVEADAIPAADYEKAGRSVAALLGLPEGAVDAGSYQPERLLYKPSKFLGEEHAAFIADTSESATARAFTSADITSPSTDKVKSNEDEEGDIANLRPTLDGVTIAEARRVLAYLDPDCSYAEWVNVCMALKHQFPAEPAAAFGLFDEWSARAKIKYEDTAATRKKWDSVKANPLDRAPVTFASVLKLAKQLGYKKLSDELPPIVSAQAIFANRPPRPDELIKGVLFRRRKFIIAAPSKARKTWANLDLAVSVASGMKWLGYATQQAPVLYLDFELGDYEFAQRLGEVVAAKLAEDDLPLYRWGLRGRSLDLDKLLPEMRRFALEKSVGLIVVDPLYAALQEKDENSNSDMSNLMLELERLAQETGAAISIVHHFAKGNASGKDAQDRMSGAGALARAADAMLVLTPHENDTDDTPLLVADFIVRSFKKPAKTVLSWQHPLWVPDGAQNPEDLKKAKGGRQRTHHEQHLVELLGGSSLKHAELKRRADRAGIRGGSFTSLLSRAVDEGFIDKNSDGTYGLGAAALI